MIFGTLIRLNGLIPSESIMNQRIADMLIRLAIKNSGTNGRFKMAAGIVYRKQLLAVGTNSYKSHPWMVPEKGYKDGQIFLHAETDAIKNALRLITQDQLAKCELYVVRVKRPDYWNGNSDQWIKGLARPCPGCMRTVASFGVKRIFWTEDEDKENSSILAKQPFDTILV